MVDDVLTDGATKREAVALLKSIVPGARFPALVIAVNRQETLPDGSDACTAFTSSCGVPVFAAVTMTEVLGHLDETGRLPAADRARCVEYLSTYGTAEAKSWAAKRR
jgi:orotate phosphoribosyltransferase